MRLFTSSINRVARRFGGQLISLSAWEHYQSCIQRLDRLKRDCALLRSSVATRSDDTTFDRHWKQFLAEHIDIEYSRSGHGQDLFGLFCLAEMKTGYFVEFGAYDGLFSSNSYLFEKRGWDGLLIEPLRWGGEQCRRNRKADFVHGAVDPSFRGEGEIEIIKAGSKSSASVKAPGGESCAQRLQVSDEERRDRALKRGDIERSPLLNLHKVLESRTDCVDFITIDVEGEEASIVEGFDFNRFQVKVVCVEHNWRPDDLQRISAALTSRGFVHVLSYASARDAWFVQRDLFEQVESRPVASE